MKNYRTLIPFIMLFVLIFCSERLKHVAASSYLLWHNKTFAIWDDALPLDNGRIGVMLFGNTGTTHDVYFTAGKNKVRL